MGVSERYECKACGKKFTYNPGFVGRYYSADDIIGAIQDVAMGKSSAQAAPLVYYNLFRPHSGMGGKTPTEALGIILKGPDKWLTAIRHAVLFCT